MKSTLRKLLMVPYTFSVMNWAAVAGLYYFMRGSLDTWNPAGVKHS